MRVASIILGFLLMSLMHYFGEKIVLIKKLKVKTASKISHDNKVFIFWMSDEVESVSKIGKSIDVQ